MSQYATQKYGLVDFGQKSLLRHLPSTGKGKHVDVLGSSYERALRAQPSHPLLETPASNYLAYVLIATGNTLVISSMWALGLTGTYLGDYFGILMDYRVTSFPFNVVDAPMYYGSTLSFLGTAILYGKPAGILLTVEVLAIYMIALTYEDPFTAEIYAKRERERKQGKKNS
ncbi:Phosphatidyl-N-methylethanolamine N-methyltransferase [Bachmanniomyces sp. S44760]|nr:Phosphatidyl-N-methylethanolamine N-methyltransferase [Bachmanniomyces sp. S44760]